jgi:hypothetical protein
LKSLPSRTQGGHGVSRFEPNTLPVAFWATQSEIRSSPVYAGHAIKPLMKLFKFHRGRLQSWTGFEAVRLAPKAPAHIPPKRRVFSSFRAIQADVLKGMIS